LKYEDKDNNKMKVGKEDAAQNNKIFFG